MNHRFVVLKHFVFELDCTCSNCMQKIEMKKGNILTITPEKKYADGMGWYFLIDINNEHQIYISIYDFEGFYLDGKICSFLDFELRMNYIEYKVNQALDLKDCTQFEHYANKKNEMKKLKEKMTEELNVH
jgi:hypothetical protein